MLDAGCWDAGMLDCWGLGARSSRDPEARSDQIKCASVSGVLYFFLFPFPSAMVTEYPGFRRDRYLGTSRWL